MCGLIGYLGRTKKHEAEEANDYIAEQYQEQMSRGTKGFGFMEIFDNGTFRIRRAVEPTLMLVDLRLSQASHFLLHHRAPTSTSNMISQTHPVHISHEELKYDYYVSHNGVIYNPEARKSDHEKLGYVYGTEYKEYSATKFLDSEALAIELARFFEKKSDIIKTRGAAAFIVAAVGKKDGKVHKVYIGTNGGNTLSLSTFEDGFAFASEERYEIAEKLERMQCIEFDAKYEKGTDGNLIGFVRAKEDIPLKFEEVAYQSYSKDFPKVTPAPTVGFHANRDTTPALPPARRKEEKPESESALNDYGKIMASLAGTSLGDIFKGKDAIAKDSVVEDNIKKFAGFFVSGEIGKAEDTFNELLESMDTVIDGNEELARALTSEIAFPEQFTVDGVLKAAEASVAARMKIMASYFVPIFRLAAYYEAALYLGHRLATAIEAGTPETPKTGLEVRIHNTVFGSTHLVKECGRPEFHTQEALFALGLLTHNESWGAVEHEVDLCKQPQWHRKAYKSNAEKEEIRKHFANHGPRHIVSDCGEPEFHMAPLPTLTGDRETMMADIQVAGADDEREYGDIEYTQLLDSPEVEEEYVDTRKKSEQEAEAAYSVFIQASETMATESILSEAEHVADSVRTSASVGIEELLLEMQATAAEEGMVMRIQHYGDEINKIVDKAEMRMTNIAQIVNKAKEVQSEEDMYGMHHG